MKLSKVSIAIIFTISLNGCSTIHSTSKAKANDESSAEYKSTKIDADNHVSKPLALLAGSGVVAVGIIYFLSKISDSE